MTTNTPVEFINRRGSIGRRAEDMVRFMSDREMGRIEERVDNVQKDLEELRLEIKQDLGNLSAKIDELMKLRNAGWGILLFAGMLWTVVTTAPEKIAQIFK